MSVCDVTTDFESIGDKSLSTLAVSDAYTAAHESAPIPKAAIPCRTLSNVSFFLFINDPPLSPAFATTSVVVFEL